MDPSDDNSLKRQIEELNLGRERPLRPDVARRIVRTFLNQTDLDAPSSAEAITDASHYTGKPPDFTIAARIQFPVPQADEDPLDEGLRWLDARVVFYESLGRFDIAHTIRQRMVMLCEIVVGTTNSKMLTPLLKLGELEIRMGEFTSADLVLDRATDLAKRMGSSATFEMVSVLHERGRALARMGLYRGAAKAIARARELLNANLSGNERNLEILEEDLAVVHLKAGQFELAKPVLERVVGWMNPKQLAALSPARQDAIASYFLVLEKFDDAARLSALAVKRLREESGEWTALYARILSNQGTIHRMRGKWQQAERDFARAAEIRQVVLGPDHPDVGQALVRLALTCAARSAHFEAFGVIKQALAISDRLLGDLNSLASQNDRLGILAEMRNQLKVAIAIVAEFFSDRPDIIGEAYSLVLRRKALAVEALVVQRNAILTGRYPHLEEKMRELDALRIRVVRDTLNVPPGEATTDRLRFIQEARDRRDELERELAREVREIRLEETLDNTNWQTIVSALPPESRLVEFFVLEPPNFRAVLANGDHEFHPPRYVAFVIDSSEPQTVRLIEIGGESEVDDLISRVTADIVNGTVDASRTAQTLGRVLRPAFAGAPSRLFIAPDGNLSLLAFDVLPILEGSSVLIDNHEITYLGTGRELLSIADPQVDAMTGPAIVADPDFDAIVASETVGREMTAAPAVAETRASMKDRLGRFERLPGAAAEGRVVASLVPGCRLLMARDATTAALRAIRRPVLLHLATHGFVLNPHDMTNRFQGDDESDAMTASGLAMAGANVPPDNAGSLTIDTGILTAEDIATLDLLDTELVVLSACDTGAGLVLRGEGVLGLRRAFRIAGARSVVMTLWTIPDDETAELMAIFYERLMAGHSKASALREAKLALRERHPSPWLWGGFVCEGDSGPMRCVTKGIAKQNQ